MYNVIIDKQLKSEIEIKQMAENQESTYKFHELVSME